MRGIVDLLPESNPMKKNITSLVIATMRRKGVIGVRGEGQGLDHHVKTDTTVRGRETTRRDTSIDGSVEAIVQADLLLQKTRGSIAAELEMITKNIERSARQVQVEVIKSV